MFLVQIYILNIPVNLPYINPLFVIYILTYFLIFTIFPPPKKSAIGDTGYLLYHGVREGYHCLHPPNGQAEHRDASPTDQGSMGGAQIAITVHIVYTKVAHPQDDTKTNNHDNKHIQVIRLYRGLFCIIFLPKTTRMGAKLMMR